MLTRRTLLTLPAAWPALAVPATAYHTGRASGRAAAPPENMRVPFGWTALPLRPEVTVRFGGAGARLRLTNALDSREIRRVEVRSARSGAALGVFDLRYAYALQLFEIPLDGDAARLAAREGVTLRQTEGSQPAWIFTDRAPAPLRPHLLGRVARDPMEEFRTRLRGPEAVQPFGWMDGCVLDALADAGDQAALRRHLDLFFPPGGHLVYEDPRSRPADDTACSIEDTLPFAHIARLRPTHPSIDAAVAYWQAHRDAEGCVVNGDLTSTEGTYTVAYPMAVIARARHDRALEDLAVRQLDVRRRRLARPDAVNLRYLPGRGHTLRNWSRGIAWYLMGLERTLEVLRDRDDLAPLRDEFRRAATWAAGLQTESGLWSCFAGEPETGAETSGSAGIAAALARGAAAGLLPESMRDPARRALAGLRPHLTPDGFLGGTAQSNRGGEELQRGGYRVITQMGMGLMGQLAAALGDA